MVELSLAHRVKMDRRASLLDEDRTPHHSRALLSVICSILLLIVLSLCLGLILTAIIDAETTVRRLYAMFSPNNL